MYWVNRKIIRNVLRNPFNPCELIKPSKANEIFSMIYEEYMDDYNNTWSRGTMPLNYFVNKFCEITGSDKKTIEQSLVEYIEENEVVKREI